jgi:hypothetical protein
MEEEKEISNKKGNKLYSSMNVNTKGMNENGSMMFEDGELKKIQNNFYKYK